MGPSWTQAKGFILGVGAKMFTIVGPVIVYGVPASVVYGLIYWITTLFYRATTVAVPTFQRIGFLPFTQTVMKYAPSVE